jgi:hypothetical protein
MEDMRRLHYSDGFVIASDEISDAVIQYAHALAGQQLSEVITIPIIDETGTPGESTILIGPASQLYTTPVEPGGLEVSDPPLLADLKAKAAALMPSEAVWPEEVQDGGEYDTDYDTDYDVDIPPDDETPDSSTPKRSS